MTTKLKLPPTLRLARFEEVPQQEDLISHIHAAESNNIVEGYTLNESHKKDQLYKFFAEINVDNDRLWSLFKTLLFAMPDEVSLITGYKDDRVRDVQHSNYMDKYELYNKLQPYEKELTLDAYLKFGVIYHTTDHLEEVFVHSAKYIQYWGADQERFTEIMNSYSLYPVENMDFIDSYPMITLILEQLQEDVISTDEVLKRLREKIQ